MWRLTPLRISAGRLNAVMSNPMNLIAWKRGQNNGRTTRYIAEGDQDDVGTKPIEPLCEYRVIEYHERQPRERKKENGHGDVGANVHML